ncbi:MAG: hypothetical protein JRE64_13905 [Deltaproteobacteria bacterium]|nr:hypothetical protein [Deltaproteobacteria bacterium]
MNPNRLRIASGVGQLDRLLGGLFKRRHKKLASLEVTRKKELFPDL